MARQTRRPRNIDEVLSGLLQSRVSEAGIPVPPGVTIYVTDSYNGRYRANVKTVTVPVWAYNHTSKKTCNDPDYAMYYVAHELAHAWVHADGKRDDSIHGRLFYEWFRKLCPPHLWHYELEYKPRDGKRAGISLDPATNVDAAGLVPPIVQGYAEAAGPGDANEIRTRAIARDPRLKTHLANVPDCDVRGYVNGWFKKPSKA